jgi:two-component system cell cycle sensor histidine kinase/response regulator CckA
VSERSDLAALRKSLEGRAPSGHAFSSALLACVLEHTPGYVTLVAPDGTILYVNRVREGLSLDATLGASVYDFSPLGQRDVLRACIEGVLRTGEPDSCESDARFADGQTGYYESRVAPIKEGHDVVALSILSLDVTGRKRVLQALRQSEEKVRMAVDAAGIGLWSWDPRSDEVVWEDALCAIFGFTPGSAPRGRDAFIALVHPEDRAHAGEVIGRGVVAGHWEDEYRIIRADGTLRWVMANGTVLREAEGGSDIVLGAVVDVTERRNRDEQLRQAQKLEAIGQLTAGIAHNFNNLLMGVLPNLELALRRAAPEIAGFLREAEHAALRAAELVRQLTTYAGRNRPPEQRIEVLGLLVDRTVAICRTTFDRRIAFETRYDSGARVHVDAAQIEQALLNILINARDALSRAEVQAPHVTLDVEVVRAGAPELAFSGVPDLDYARIRVHDNGIGMTPATLARIYEPFFTTKGVGQGTGLGLATTQAIIREHGGWITCESKPGAGTTFSLYLRSAGSLSAAPRGRSEAPPRGGVETVLVIDDEPGIRNVVSLMLESAGYTAKVAASGPEALELLADPRVASVIALILLDVSMPGIPGPELRRRLRALVPRARILYFTGYAVEAIDADDIVVEKPVSEARLLRTVRAALDRAS